jgi:neurotransmitter-gated ion-channel
MNPFPAAPSEPSTIPEKPPPTHTLPASGRPRRSRHRGLARRMAVCGLLLGLAASTARAALDVDLSRPDGGRPTPVRLELYLVDLHEIFGSEQAFLADVAMKAEWRDPRLAGRWSGVRGVPLNEIWNPRLQLLNQRGVTLVLPPRVEVDATGRVTYRQLFSGRFSARMNFTDFPLDHHRFSIQLVTLGYSPAEVELRYAGNGLRSGRAAHLAISDWKVGPARMTRAGFALSPGGRPLAGAALRWEASRNLAYPAVQVILPLVLIVLMGWTAMWPDPSAVPARVSIAVTTMLTLIAYRFTLARSLPNLDYLTRMDYFMLTSTVLVFLVVVLVTLCSRLLGQGRQELVARIDRWAVVAFPVLFAVIFALAWWG